MILNVQDTCWSTYFTPDEIQEIKTYQAIELPLLPPNIIAFLDELKATPRDKLYEFLNGVNYAPHTDEHWIQSTYNDCFRLLRSGFFPLHGVTEQGIGKRMWSCLDKCFDYLAVRCIT